MADGSPKQVMKGSGVSGKGLGEIPGAESIFSTESGSILSLTNRQYADVCDCGGGGGGWERPAGCSARGISLTLQSRWLLATCGE